MSKKALKSRVYTDGVARYRDLLYVMSKDKKLLEREVSHSSVVALDGEEWVNVIDAPWDSTAIAIALPTKKMVLVGEDGQVLTYVGGDSEKEQIKPQPRMIRRAKAIDGCVHACGVGREVFRRAGERVWQSMHATKPKPNEKVGFEAIDGFSQKEIYAVGWRGEIWQFDGAVWVHCGSGLTNLILTSVCCAENDVVYVAGQQGILIRGRRDTWEIVQWDDEFDTDFWDVLWFKKELYLATMTGLYTLKDDQLVPVEFDDTVDPTCYRLSTAEGVLWSIGASDVMSFDGKRWRNHTR